MLYLSWDIGLRALYSYRACPRSLGTIITYDSLVLMKGGNCLVVHQRGFRRFQLFALDLIAAEQSPVCDREARHNLVVHVSCFLLNLLLYCSGIYPV